MADSNAERQRRKRAKPGYVDATAKERQARYRRKHRPVLGRCRVCGEPLWGTVPLAAGVHQKCDRAEYMKVYRRLKKGG